MYRLVFLVVALLCLVLPAAAQVTPPTNDASARHWLVGVWRGTYTCPQGITGLTLTVTEGQKGLEGIWNSYAVPENPKLPEAKFTFRVEFTNGGRSFRGLQQDWILRPVERNRTWYMVDFSGTWQGGGVLTGDVDGGSRTVCTTFRLERDEQG